MLRTSATTKQYQNTLAADDVEHPIPPPAFKAPDEAAEAVSASGDTEDDSEEDDASDSEYRPGLIVVLIFTFVSGESPRRQANLSEGKRGVYSRDYIPLLPSTAGVEHTEEGLPLPSDRLSTASDIIAANAATALLVVYPAASYFKPGN